MTPTLSIIIPCYNVENYVQAALQSVLDNLSPSNHTNIELLIVNDGSTDQTLEKIQQFLPNFHAQAINYHLIKQANSGLSAARNTAMERAKGKYWLFLDSDDIFINNALDKIIDCIHKNNTDIIEFDATKFIDNIFEQKTLYNDYFPKVVHTDWQTHRLYTFQENRWYVWSRCYHNKLFKNQKFENGKLFEDMMTIPYCYLTAQSVFRLPESLIGYRQRPASILATLSHRHLDDLYFGIEKAMLSEPLYPQNRTELIILQYKNWRLIVAESIKKFLKTRDHSYLTSIQHYRAQMRQKYQRDYGWQIGYFCGALINKYLKNK